MIDFDAIKAALDPATVVPQWLPGGRRRGNEWVALNPTRSDAHHGSFSVNLVTGRWADFAAGEKGGDLIDLYAYLYCGKDLGAAARELADKHTVAKPRAARPAAAPPPAPEPAQVPRMIVPVPENAPPPHFHHRRLGKPSKTWKYMGLSGERLLYICRFDPPGERKQVMPLSWCTHPEGGQRWTWRGYTGDAKRPLYGLELLRLHDGTLPVVLVEGEPAADAGRAMLGDRALVMTWLGGVETANRVDLRPLRGRDVVLWPDADLVRYPSSHPRAGELMPLHEQPGNRAMLTIAKALEGVAKSVLIVRYDPAMVTESGRDLADDLAAGWDGDDVLAYMAENAVPPAELFRTAGPARDLVPMHTPLDPSVFADRSSKGQPLNTHRNLLALLQSYGIGYRYNLMRHCVDLTVPGSSYSRDNAAVCSLAEVTSLCALNRVPRVSVVDYLVLLSDKHHAHPVLEWIRSVPWDGRSRLPELYATITGPHDKDPAAVQLRQALIYRWLVSAVAALVVKDFAAQGVLVFQGPQDAGKTFWLQSLVPADLGAVLDGALLDPDNKDTVVTAITHWLVELGELNGNMNRVDVERLKAFITRKADKVRRPYDRLDTEFKRRTVFFGSVNPAQFLSDDTGNRRWWICPVTRCDHRHNINLQQLWAEILRAVEQGAQWWLTPEEKAALAEANRNHESIDPMEELITKRFDMDGKGQQVALTATEVLLEIGYATPTRGQANHCARLLAKMGKASRKSTGRKVFDIHRRG